MNFHNCTPQHSIDKLQELKSVRIHFKYVIARDEGRSFCNEEKGKKKRNQSAVQWRSGKNAH